MLLAPAHTCSGFIVVTPHVNRVKSEAGPEDTVSEVGIKQARILRTLLDQNFKPDLVVAAPHPRMEETGRALYTAEEVGDIRTAAKLNYTRLAPTGVRGSDRESWVKEQWWQARNATTIAEMLGALPTREIAAKSVVMLRGAITSCVRNFSEREAKNMVIVCHGGELLLPECAYGIEGRPPEGQALLFKYTFNRRDKTVTFEFMQRYQ